MALALSFVVAGCGSGASTAGTPTPAHTGPPAINVADTWPDAFCRATIGMTRDQMRGLMGEPTKESTSDSSEPQMVWKAYGYHFTALFGADDKVRQLDIDDTELSPEQKTDLHCEMTRTQ